MNFELWFRCNKNETTGDFYQWDGTEALEAKRTHIAKLLAFSEKDLFIYPMMGTFKVEVFSVPLIELPAVVQRIEKVDFFENWLKVSARI